MNSKRLHLSRAIISFLAALSSSIVYAEGGFDSHGVAGASENNFDPLAPRAQGCAAAFNHDDHNCDWTVDARNMELLTSI